jgi:hypothetical protein
VETKWEYIARKLEEEYSNPEAAGAARWMDAFLRKNYPYLHTPEWVDYIEDIPFWRELSLGAVMNSCSFCTACAVESYQSDYHDSACNNCLFGSVFGRCRESNSWYVQLRNLL